ncbi:TPA: ISLre2 family transposase [Streptococcus suis]|uniref:ISLre2 family transposase n=1 Tax=Streptococcus suis TaxID=1307 RepID=UPI000696B303|nr:ISLre2 family transposase [Streptococcus suis]NQG46850.1 ISLre2 family transposase [Streptococcus suis]NQN66377.1 ISLre2 family transposase [Streptococcus suis]NQN85670.1 ISLre2 family transposase [Streptococcus suis]NQN99696.1 ISLre2 family transposase [Streptococcus suis]NQO03438.1 ISLre2 family transposase [Streptococcus suis]
MRFDERNFVIEMDEYRRQEFLKRIRDYDDSIAPTMRQNGYKRVDATERTVLFTFGEITFSRNRWRRGQKTLYPVDDWLGLERYMRYSPELIFHMAKHASKLSYREVCRTICDTYRIGVTKDAVLKATKVAGQLIEEKERYRFYLEEEQAPQRIKASKIYLEGDGVMVKTTLSGNEPSNTDLTHFLVHTGVKQVTKDRWILENKHEIVHVNYEKAKEELLDYLYNHFEITDQTILITNSDNGKGYTKRTFQEIKKALGIKRHEHFWDEYHLNQKIKTFFKPYPETLYNLAQKAIQTHKKPLLITVLDTVESFIETEEQYETYFSFRQKMIRNFKDTKPAKLRNLSHKGIGVMESQHRKITYRMKHRGMYWSINGACTMAKMILLERIDQLEQLFFGDWRKSYQPYQNQRFSAGRANKKIKEPPNIRRYRSGHKTGRWLTHVK